MNRIRIVLLTALLLVAVACKAEDGVSFDIGVDQTVNLPDQTTVTFFPTSTTLGYGSFTNPEWTVDSGPAPVTFSDYVLPPGMGEAAVVTFTTMTRRVATFTAPGMYVLRLTITLNPWAIPESGIVPTLRLTDTVQVFVTSPDFAYIPELPPPPIEIVSPLRANEDPAVVAEPVTFTVGASSSASRPIQYFWDFGDGSTASGDAMQTHTFSAEGVFTVKVTARDDVGNEASNELKLTVNGNTVVNLGAISVKRGHFKLELPVPVGFEAEGKVSATLLTGIDGAKLRVRGLKATGTLSGTGSFQFTVKLAIKKSEHTRNVTYRFQTSN